MSKGEERQAAYEFEKNRKLDFQNHGMNPTQTTHDDIDFLINTECGNGGTYPKDFDLYSNDEIIKKDIESMIAKCDKWLTALRTANEMKSAIMISWYAKNAKQEFDRLYNMGLKFEAYFDGYFAAFRDLKTK